MKSAELFERTAAFAKSRGDINAAFYCLAIGILVQEFRGNFQYVIDLLAFYEANPILREEPFVPRMLLSFLLKRALIRGDKAEVLMRRTIYLAHIETFFTVTVCPGLSQFFEGWCEVILNNNFSDALEHLIQAFNMVELEEMAAHVMNWISTAPFLMFLLCDLTRSGLKRKDEIYEAWGAEDLSRLRGVLSKLRLCAHRLRKFVFCWWAMHALDAATAIMDGKAARGVRLLRQKMNGSRKGELEQVPLYKALYCGVISKYTAVKKDQEECGLYARNVFQSVDSKLYICWLET
ncbi:hypothetical protein HK101_009301 [Irineochytrium annulatum]|nr:hypothetical protein HK101_009301 [Irineochytrium annulatum]